MKRLPLISLLLLCAIVARAQDLDTVAANSVADLERSLAELTAVRKQIEEERLPLARQVADLEQKLAQRRAELARAQRFQENQLVQLNALKAEARRHSDEVKYIESLLAEYGRAFRSRLNFVEEPLHRDMFDEVERVAAATDLSAAAKLERRTTLLAAALERDNAALGGEVFDGKALDTMGRVVQGKVALMGPVAMFAGVSGETAGLLQMELNRSDPTIIHVDRRLDDASRLLATTGSGELVLDPTLGNAFKLTLLKESLVERLAEGGLIMIPLLGLGLAALIVGVWKWVQLARIRLANERDLQKVLCYLDERERDKALAHARSIPGLAGDLLAAAVEHAGENKEYIEEVLYEKMLGARARLDRGIAFLALSATTGPLLGLLGTVMGMIATFKLISSFGSGDPKTLAAGISEALICTATGMAVAIPSLLFHAFLSRKAKGVLGSMEQTAVGFINGLPDEEKPAFAT